MWAIYGISDWQWWASFGWFWVAIAVSWFLPGLVVLNQLKISKTVQFFVAPILGMSLWALQGYIFGWLGLRELTYLYVAIFLFFAWRDRKSLLPLSWKPQLPSVVWFLLIVGMVLQLVPVWGSGWMSDAGVKYYFVNIFDGVFHLSLTRSIIEHFPPQQPGAIGLPVTNYHYLSNLVLAELTRIWQLPLNHLYFQYLPVFGSFWLGLLVTLLLKQWSSKTWTLVFGLLLFYGVGELSWLINILLGSHSTVPFEVFIDHGVLQFLNPPQAFAKLVFFAVLLLLHQFWLEQNWRLAAVIGIMAATIVGFKVYFGLGMAAGLAAACGVNLLVWFWQRWADLHQRTFKIFWNDFYSYGVLALVAIVFAAIIYLPANAAAGGIFFDFLTWPKLLLGFTKLNWNEWWLRLQVYEAAGNFRALAAWYGIAVTIFFVAIYHIRLFGFLALFPRFRQGLLLPEVAFLAVPAMAFTFVGTNFLQTSGGSNIFNFMVVALTLLNLLTAVVLGELAKNKVLAVVAVLLVSLTMVQTVWVQYFFISNYARGTNSQLISNEHLEALEFIKKLPSSTVLQTLPTNLLDDNTPYLYFFTGQKSYFGGRGILNSHNQPVADRVKILDQFISQRATVSAQVALDVGITDLLVRHGHAVDENFYLLQQETATQSALPHWRQVFENAEIIVLQPVAGSEN